jgi:hypothetical protein
MPRKFPRSLPEFQRLFPDESACIQYLVDTRLGAVLPVVRHDDGLAEGLAAVL